jgi:hypothetical protein
MRFPSKDFIGTLGGINENPLTTGSFFVAKVTSIDLFAQSTSNNQRSYGPGNVYVLGSAPSSDLLYISGQDQYTLGFGVVHGVHYTPPTELWTGSGTGSLEYFPPDKC